MIFNNLIKNKIFLIRIINKILKLILYLKIINIIKSKSKNNKLKNNNNKFFKN